MREVRLVRGHWIITGAGAADRVLRDAAIAIDGPRIEMVGSWSDLRTRYPNVEVIGSERVAVLPGFINAHHHSSGVSTLQQGLPDLLLEPWILRHAGLRPTDVYLDTLLSAARLLRSGITSVVDVCSGHGSAEDYASQLEKRLQAYDETGLRVALATGLSDQSHIVSGRGEDKRFLAGLPDDLRRAAETLMSGSQSLSEDDYFAIMDDFADATKEHERLDLWFAPPGPQWVSDPFLQRIAERAETNDSGIQTHVTESIYEKLHGPRFYGKDTVAHLHDLGILSPRFSIAHGVWLTETEIEILAETGAAVSHNPSSNLRLRAGIAPVNALLDAGITTALGMDGTTLNDDEDMFTEMRLALRLNRTPWLDGPAPTPTQIFELATVGGAKLLRKDSELGQLAPGFAADLVIVDLGRITWPWVAPEVDPRELVMLRACASDVETVMVAGEIVLCQGQPTRFDPAEAGKELAERMARVAFPAEAAALAERLQPHVEAYYKGWEMPELVPYAAYNSKH